ncbi:hypothetical protein EIP86_010622 [Pleurotus ostreatoroseus]|nr:hypothetical protein EIP86_010622 [Pleurotus ostreatoroseus]
MSSSEETLRELGASSVPELRMEDPYEDPARDRYTHAYAEPAHAQHAREDPAQDRHAHEDPAQDRHAHEDPAQARYAHDHARFDALYAPTQRRTLGDALAGVRETKARLLAQTAALPVLYIPPLERRAYERAFARARGLAREVEGRVPVLWLWCAPGYVRGVIEVIVAVQSQGAVLHTCARPAASYASWSSASTSASFTRTSTSQEQEPRPDLTLEPDRPLGALLTPADLHTSTQILAAAARTARALEAWCASEEGRRLVWAAGDAHGRVRERLGAFVERYCREDDEEGEGGDGEGGEEREREWTEVRLKRVRETDTPPLTPITPCVSMPPAGMDAQVGARRGVKRRRTSVDSGLASEGTAVDAEGSEHTRKGKGKARERAIDINKDVPFDLDTYQISRMRGTWTSGMRETGLRRRLRRAEAGMEVCGAEEEVRPEDSVSVAAGGSESEEDEDKDFWSARTSTDPRDGKNAVWKSPSNGCAWRVQRDPHPAYADEPARDGGDDGKAGAVRNAGRDGSLELALALESGAREGNEARRDVE